MQFDWTILGAKPPVALVRARNLAHHAVQWVARAARANLEAVPDDSHTSFSWDRKRGAFMSQPLSAGDAEVRIGFKLRGFALVIVRNNRDLDEFELGGRKDSSVSVWFDSALRALGLKAAGEVELPYSLPSLPVARGSAYHVSGESDAFEELAAWFDAAADLLADVTAAQAGAGPMRCWPHHFDLATVIDCGTGGNGSTRSIGVGMSPGDEHYAQPYFYVSPSPRLKPSELPLIAEPGHWHLQGFFGAVATAEDVLPHSARGETTMEFINTTIALGRERLAA